jgi:hypothetical protein
MALLAFAVRRHTIVCADNAMLDLRDLRHKTEKGDGRTQVSVSGWYAGHCASFSRPASCPVSALQGRSRFMAAPPSNNLA